MNTSKLTSLYIVVLLGTLLLTSILSIPVQAQTVAPGDNHHELAAKPPTKTKRPRNNRGTRTPQPANTATNQPPTQQSTSVAAASSTPVATGTPVGTETLVSTSLPTSTFSSDMNTVVSELTATSQVIRLTSTSMALTATSTPTLVGAPTSTPNDLELTVTSIAATTAPLQVSAKGTATGSPTATSAGYEIPITSQKSNSFLGRAGALWVFLGGAVILGFLFTLLARELKKTG